MSVLPNLLFVKSYLTFFQYTGYFGESLTINSHQNLTYLVQGERGSYYLEIMWIFFLYEKFNIYHR